MDKLQLEIVTTIVVYIPVNRKTREIMKEDSYS